MDSKYITVLEMAVESGQQFSVIYNWLRYHGLEHERVDGQVAVRRAEWDEFKATHPAIIIASR